MDEGGVSSLVFHVDSHKLHLSQEPLQNGNLDTRGPLSRRGLVSSLLHMIIFQLIGAATGGGGGVTSLQR